MWVYNLHTQVMCVDDAWIGWSQEDKRGVRWLQKRYPSKICTTWSSGKQVYQRILARLINTGCRHKPKLALLLIHNYLAKHANSLTFYFLNLKLSWMNAVSKP